MGNAAFKDYETLYEDTPRFVQKDKINGIECERFWRCGTYYLKCPNGSLKPILQHFLELYEQIEAYYYGCDEGDKS